MAGRNRQPGSSDPDYLAWKSQQTKNNTPRRNQFADITDYEPFDITRNNFDNPPFSWPAKQYTDITGNQIKVQRGYMRSLITDPRWSMSSSAKNRRLFFQFNPTVLVRSVQQTVGAMNPLLQDPAQLLQPVPGTATFGFELLFNREQEVASGMSYPAGQQPTTDNFMVLPNGDFALPSQVGVLADIMVLDSITGQGISKDMIDVVAANSQNVVQSDITSREEQIKALSEGDDNGTQIALEQATIGKLREKIDSLSEQYNLNIGNQAFLNPLPFRVLFSSLFMIEGVATSVEVQYQKFSATMVPTQCKVIINMYALYIGFAQRDTFLTKNLESSYQEAKAAQQAEQTARIELDYGIRSISVNQMEFNGSVAANKATVRMNKLEIELSESLIDKIKTKDINEIYMNVFMRFQLYSGSGVKASQDELTLRGQFATNDGKPEDFKVPVYKAADSRWKLPFIPTRLPFVPNLRPNDSNGIGGLKSVEVNDILVEEAKQASPRKYLSYQLEFIIVADGHESTPILFPIVNEVNWDTALGIVPGAFETPPQKWTNNQSTRRSAPSSQ